MRVWVTGSGGQVGQVLIRALLQKGIDCFGTSHADADIADEETVRSWIERATHIVNTAAYSEVDPAETHRDKAYRANVMGPAALAKISRETGVHLLHISTDYVFDGKLGRPYVEDDEPHPLNWYGETKREGEIRVLEANPEACVVRVSWIFGGGGQKNYAPKILHALQTQKELRFVDDQKELSYLCC
jgi:dTDP-4-dehydrorhamnose reductase